MTVEHILNHLPGRGSESGRSHGRQPTSHHRYRPRFAGRPLWSPENIIFLLIRLLED